MTKPKPRAVKPYTLNIAFSFATSDMQADMHAEIVSIIAEYFEDRPAIEETLSHVWNAATEYGLSISGNPDRKITQAQRLDRQELIETMKELRIRLDPLHIPLPLLNNAGQAYSASNCTAPTLKEEIGSTLIKLETLLQLFDSIDIPMSQRTNPGKPERDNLVKQLVLTFDEMTSKDEAYKQSSSADIRIERHEFVTRICRLIDPDIKVPRRL